MEDSKQDVESQFQAPPSKPSRDGMAPAKFAAGWYYGITGEDERRTIKNCFQNNDELTNLLYDAMAAYVRGDM